MTESDFDFMGGPSSEPTEPPLQFVTFAIGTAEYAIDIKAVREIKRWVDTTPLPNAPEYVRGVINLRGIIVPIYDLRSRFGLGLTEPTRTHVVIIVRLAARLIGFLVDVVSDILTIGREFLRPLPDIEQSPEDAYLDGIITLDDRMIAVLGVERVLTVESLKAGATMVRQEAAGARIEAVEMVTEVEED